MQGILRTGLLLNGLLAVMLAGCLGGGDPARAACILDERPIALHPDSAGPVQDIAILEITRDHGTVPLKRTNATAQAGDSVLDVLMRHAEVETGYGGGFVEAIDGLASGYPDEQVDWFFEVNGITAQVGAADVDVKAGDHIHWDFRAWGAAAPAGHFNSFPWHQASRSVWQGSWPAEPAVVAASADEAPWDVVPWAATSGGTLVACGRSFDAPWALLARADPPGSQRALFVGDALSGDLPSAGHAWIQHAGATYEVEIS